MPKPSVIIDEGDQHMEVGTAKPEKKGMLRCEAEERCSRETEWKDIQRK